MRYSIIALVNFGAYLLFDFYNLFKFGSIHDDVGNVIRDLLVEAVLPLLNFIFYVSSNKT